MKKYKFFGAAVICGFLLTGCGEDEALLAYQEDMSTFFENAAVYNDNMNAIDPNSEDAVSQLLAYLDGLQNEITWMAQLEVPEQFSAAESLADEADENMKEAVALFHQAYEGETYDEALGQAALEYYERTNVRIQYIITILHGEIPEGEGVTYTEEEGIFGGGFLNKTEDEEGTEESSGEESTEEDSAEDDFDTDDTVFYEEPSEEIEE